MPSQYLYAGDSKVLTIPINTNPNGYTGVFKVKKNLSDQASFFEKATGAGMTFAIDGRGIWNAIIEVLPPDTQNLSQSGEFPYSIRLTNISDNQTITVAQGTLLVTVVAARTPDVTVPIYTSYAVTGQVISIGVYTGLNQVQVGGGSSGGTTNGLTDSQLRASPIPVSGVNFSQLEQGSNLTSVNGSSIWVTGTPTNNDPNIINGNQKTQIISGPNSLGIDSFGRQTVNINGLIGVTGSFYPASQTISGTVNFSNTGINIGNFPASQAITASSLPLPVGAATNATLTDGTQKTQIFGNVWVTGTNAFSNTGIGITNWPTTQAVSISSLPLPSNAATDASLTNGNQKTQVINGANSLFIDTAGRIGVTGNFGGAINLNGSSVWMTGSSVSINNSIAITNTGIGINNWPTSQLVTASSLPLPTNAATDASLTNGNQKSQITNGTNTLFIDNGGRIGVTGNFSGQPVLGASIWVTGSSVNIGNSIAITNTGIGITNWPTSQVVNVSNFPSMALDSTLTGGNAKVQLVNGSNSLFIDNNGRIGVTGNFGGTANLNGSSIWITGSSLPVGAATESTLDSINSKLGGIIAVSGVNFTGGTSSTVDTSGSSVFITGSTLPDGAATEATLASLSSAFISEDFATSAKQTSIDSKLPALRSSNVYEDDAGIPVRTVPSKSWRTTFSSVVANNIDTQFWDLKQTGSGQSINQTGGNLVITTGTTINAETVIRSKANWKDAFFLKYGIILSQRIANNNFFIELVDIIGDSLSYTINSATSVTITFPISNPFTSANIGQYIHLGIITGAAGIPGRYAIASVSGLTVTFTVAAWPASGSGTLSLFGWNYHQIIYTSTTATNCTYDAQRNGWASGATTATINTSASPGHMGQLYVDDGMSIYSDALVASSTSFQFTQRASRVQNIPDPTTQLYLQIRTVNGSTAPASTTTATINFAAMEEFAAVPVVLQAAKQIGAGGSLSVQVQNAISSTVTSISAGTNAIGDVGLQVRANATGAATAQAITSLAATTAVAVKASAGRVLNVYLFNSAAQMRSFKVFNVAQASVTMGTTSAAYEINIPATGVANISIPVGIAHSTAISYAFTSAIGLTNNTATNLAAGDVTGTIIYA